ncbi:hypothetical protein TcWFU_006440 [Taenia crassiceps]|uniref:Uncharacterized protein n=1 Tax=Taenia crassiceps TaxID=6207 RepID=A0ABR4QH27_9CEST
MVLKANEFGDFSVRVSPLKHLHRRRTKREIHQQSERHIWTPDLVAFVCDELTDPCTRAAFLRRHAYHEICSNLPPLYLLPHIDDVIEGSNQSSTQLCNSEDKGVRSTDGLYRRYLETPNICRRSLETLDTKIRSSLTADLGMFVDILERSFCLLANNTNNTMLDECIQCQKAYWSWVCTTAFPIFYPLAKLPPLDGGGELAASITASAATVTATTTTSTPPLPSSINTVKSNDQLRNAASFLHQTTPARLKSGATKATATGIFVLERVPACMTWCTQVETLCPYFNPSDSTSNGGEPTFLCDESHYQYAPSDNPHSVSYYTGCEFDCCFTEQDFLVDVIMDDIPLFTGSSSNPSSADHSAVDVSTASAVGTGMWRAGRTRGDGGQKREDKGEQFSLTERCLHRQLSERLGHGAGPLVVDQTLLRQSNSLSASTLSDAFLSAVTATIVIVAVRLG